MSLAVAKSTLVSTLATIFEDVSEGNTAADKAEAVADAIDAYTTAAVATVTIPIGTVVVVPGTGGALNVAAIPLEGDPDSGTGGLS